MHPVSHPNAYVYVDGFNLYYGAVKGTPYKWLDLAALSRFAFPRYFIDRIHYFTARVGRPRGGADPSKPQRQQVYLRALGTIPNLDIHYGRFLLTKTRMALVDPPPGGPRTAEVFKTEEKGSDVNLASYLRWMPSMAGSMWPSWSPTTRTCLSRSGLSGSGSTVR